MRAVGRKPFADLIDVTGHRVLYLIVAVTIFGAGILLSMWLLDGPWILFGMLLSSFVAGFVATVVVRLVERRE